MKICPNCNNSFSSVRIGQKHCSPKCYWEKKKGSKNSWGNKISRALKGRVKTKEHLQNISNALKIRKDLKAKDLWKKHLIL